MAIPDKIDIILPWVDSLDKVWLDSYNKYTNQYNEGDKRIIRFRDWGLLRYWFRGIEKNMPWINRIYFITADHKPEWLNLEHPKLNWVKHSDFIPEKYLPTFNINAIELNLHRIDSLSEYFIYLNDDIFILNNIPAKRFFQKGLPCDYGVMTAKPSGGGIIHMAINDLEVLDAFFDKHTQMKKFSSKWFNLKYGKGLINNLLLFPWKEFSGFIDPHLPNSFLKSTFTTVWEKAPDILDKTCQMKFRTNNDVNQWLIRYWQLAEGNFTPYNTQKRALNLDITDRSVSQIADDINHKKYDVLCMNDSDEIKDFEKTKSILKESFENIFPQKSSFEY